MLSKRFHQFVRDERGSYTLWSLVWFMLYVAIGGLAVDVTDAYRNETMLQSTADAAALAGVMSIGVEDEDPVDQALAYAVANMDPEVNGTVLKDTEVFVGTWDFDVEHFTANTADPNAVYVVTRRGDANGNPVARNFLRILMLFGADPSWNVNSDAIAVRHLPECVADGFIAKGEVYFRSNNDFYRDICIHGQMDGVRGRMGNIYEEGVSITHGPMSGYDFPPAAYNEDDLQKALKGMDNLWPKEAEHDVVTDTIDYLKNLPLTSVDLAEKYGSWEYMYRAQDADGRPILDPATGDYELVPVTHEWYSGGNLPEIWKPNTVYHFTNCGQINLGSGVELSRLAIVADCRIHSAADTSAGNVIFASTHESGSDAIHMAADSGLGYADYCQNGEGGVEIYTLGDVMMAARGEWHGLRITATGNVDFTSQNNGAYGIAVHAGGDINFRTTSEYGLCEGDRQSGPIEWRYRLVR